MLTLYLDHEELLRADQDLLYISGIVSTSIGAFSHKEQTAFEKSCQYRTKSCIEITTERPQRDGDGSL
jgi:hypothetical protein